MVSFNCKNTVLIGLATVIALCVFQVQAVPATPDKLTGEDFAKLLKEIYKKDLDEKKVMAATRKNYLCRSKCYIDGLNEKRTKGFLESQDAFKARISKESKQVEDCVQKTVSSFKNYNDLVDYMGKTKVLQLTVAQYCADKDRVAQLGFVEIPLVNAYAAYCDLVAEKCGAIYDEEMKQIAEAAPAST